MSNDENPAWKETDSALYLTLADIAVPDRERQTQIIVDLVGAAAGDNGGTVAELCCGGGDLGLALLSELPGIAYLGLDGSEQMLSTTRLKLADHADRVSLDSFDLAARDWRRFTGLSACVSSLAVHHLAGPDKATLFADIRGMLRPGGVFVLADIMEPATAIGARIAAREWDDNARQRSRARSGDDTAFNEFQRARWNYFTYGDDEGLDVPSPVADHLAWLREAGFVGVDVHFFLAGHGIIAGWKQDD